MGTQINLIFYTSNQTKADSASQLVFERIDALNEKLSDYIEDSELNRLCKKSRIDVEVSNDLYNVLVASHEISEITGGAFDITVGPLISLWRKTRNAKMLPSEPELRNAKLKVGYDLVSFPFENTRGFQVRRGSQDWLSLILI
jgi:thiamine biosynthesis lipoprotein